MYSAISIIHNDLSVVRDSNRKLIQMLFNRWHSSLKAPVRWKFAFIIRQGANIIGVSAWGRPVARLEDQTGTTLEHIRMALSGEAPKNTSSWALAKQRKWIRENHPEVKRLITYIDETLYSGVTYRADNWNVVYRNMKNTATWANRKGHNGRACTIRTKYERKP